MIKNINSNKITLVGRSWSGWCSNNSLQSLRMFLHGSKLITNDNLNGWDNRIFRYMKRKTKNTCYSSLSFALEFEAFKRSVQTLSSPKLLHYWLGDNDYYYGYWIRRFTGSKIAVNIFFSLEELIERMPNKSHLLKADLITCSGLKQMEYLSQFIPETKLAFLPLGIDTDFFSPLNDNNLNNPTLILQVGFNRRDFQLLKKVFIELKKELPDLSLEMAIGNQNVEKIFSGMDGITFHPFLYENDLKNMYQKASMLILPLLEGGSSQSMNEALSCGLPIVTNDLPILSDYTGSDAIISCEPGNVKQMTKACLLILKNDRVRKEMAKQARIHALQFDYINIFNKLLEIYREKLGFNIVLEQ